MKSITADSDNNMVFERITENKERYLSLLMLADEQETMINRYIEEGIMYVLNDNGVKAECVLCDAGEGIL